MKIFGYAYGKQIGSNVYFIRDGTGYIKIGVADDVAKRLSSLQTANHHELEVFMILHVGSKDDARKIEKELHEKFNGERIKGEWFSECKILDFLRNGDLSIAGWKFGNASW